MQTPIFLQTGTEKLAWFFIWGDIVFLGLAIALILYVFLHSYFKEIPALAFRLITAIPVAFIIPAVIFSLISYDAKVAMQNNIVLLFIIGLIGGIIPIVSSIAYAVYSSLPEREPESPPYIPEDPGRSTIEATIGRDRDKETIVPAPPKAKGYLIDKSSGKTHKLMDNNILGRGSMQGVSGNKIKLKDDYISRLHATINFDGNRFKISDSSSKTGTFVNNQRIRGWNILEDGDEIKIGRTYLKFTQAK